nr:SMP-30/gluconolactonase/LRE family protein [uncultured Cohaesibacter sp.]
MWTPAEYYPDPAIEVLDERFNDLYVQHASIERLYTGLRWGEGPVWFGDHGTLLFSDIPNDRIMRFEENSGTVSEFRRGRFTNGNTRDRVGRLVSCEHGTRSVTRTEFDGTITTIADSYQGKRLNSPNDVVVKSDGSIWFSDPCFGIGDYYEGGKAEPELPMNVYRVDPKSGELSCVIEDFVKPNGLAFSIDESKLYLVETRGGIHVFDVVEHGRALANGRKLVDAGDYGAPDGIRLDIEGNIWAGWGVGVGNFGVRCFAPDGTALGHIHLPERCANICFGGRNRTRLFMAASHSLYSLYVKVPGLPYF